MLPFPSSVAERLGGFDEDKILPSSKKDKSYEFSGDSCGKPFAKNPVPLEASVAARGSLPWIVPLFKRTELGLQFLCSASLITRQLVVTGIKIFFLLFNVYHHNEQFLKKNIHLQLPTAYN